MRGKEAMILNEIEVLKKVSKGHSNIVTLWDYFETPNNRGLLAMGERCGCVDADRIVFLFARGRPTRTIIWDLYLGLPF